MKAFYIEYKDDSEFVQLVAQLPWKHNIIYPKFQTLSGKLSWSYYCELLSIKNNDERNFFKSN
jgi:hypothetical protein